jgi:hypothetical protein
VIAAVLFVLGGAATLAISPESGNGKGDRGQDLTMEQLGARLASTMQSDLRDAQRKRNLDGRITVVRVDPRASAAEHDDHRPPRRGRRLGRQDDLAHARLTAAMKRSSFS